MMKRILFLLLILPSMVWAQKPAPSDLSGEALKAWLRTNYHQGKHNTLGYTQARVYLYNYIDNQNNKLYCVYSGLSVDWKYGGKGSNPDPINCEHTVPQSFFKEAEPMKSDLHHLFPTYQNWNSTRSNFPYAEIDDSKVEKWMNLRNTQANKPSGNIDQYSEFSNGTFEPREDHKGNVARAIFYFYTMYPTQAGKISSVADPNTLYKWHLSDPVDARERERNNKIESYQGDRNPYIDYPELVARAWGFQAESKPVVKNDAPKETPKTEPPKWEASKTGGADLFISEYVEGTSYDKVIEIANFTGATINLANYTLAKQTNGAGDWDHLKLSGSLPHGSVYVIAHSSANKDILSVANLPTNSTIMNFNGNDPVALFKNGTLIDVVGVFNGGDNNFAADVTLVRNAAAPTASFNASQWQTFPSGTIMYLGMHQAPAAKKPATWSPK